MMSKLFFLLSSLVCIGHGQRSRSSSIVEAQVHRDPVKALAMLLHAYNAPTGFVPRNQGARLPAGMSTRINSRPMVMSDEVAEEVEEVEKRRDADGGIFSQQEFMDYYGEEWEEKWEAATPAGDIKPLASLSVGDVIEKAEVQRCTGSAAILEIGSEVTAYMHYSRIPKDVWENEMDTGYECKVTVETVDVAKGQIGVTMGVPGEKVRTDIKMFDELQVGDVIEKAEVMRCTDSAAFLTIGAEVDGYMHYSRIPEDVWENEMDAGYECKVTIEKIDTVKGQVSVTMGVPGEKVRPDIKNMDELKVGDVIEDAEVMRCTDFGAFMNIKAEVDALCHVSKIPPKLWEELDSGHTMNVVIEKIDMKKGQVGVRHEDIPKGGGKGKGYGKGRGSSR